MSSKLLVLLYIILISLINCMLYFIKVLLNLLLIVIKVEQLIESRF